MLFISPIRRTGRFLASVGIRASRTLGHGRQLSRSEKNRVRRYRTEGEEIKLNDAYVEFVLCGKMPNLKIVRGWNL